MSSPSVTQMRRRFRELHAGGLFVVPNPWDVGSAVRLAEHFEALATTSSGLAWSLGKQDGEVTRDELITHVAALTASVGVPVSVDAERGFADDASGVADTVARLAAVGAAGCSIEDYDPATDAIDELDVAVERVAAAVEEAGRHGMVLTARCDNHFHGIDDFDDTLARLTAYRDAGAEVLYAPGIRTAEQILEVVALGRPVNVLARPGVPTVAELAEHGVRRVSTGGALARAAYDTLEATTASLRPRLGPDGHGSEAHAPQRRR